jgi:hypothetical protein
MLANDDCAFRLLRQDEKKGGICWRDKKSAEYKVSRGATDIYLSVFNNENKCFTDIRKT